MLRSVAATAERTRVTLILKATEAVIAALALTLLCVGCQAGHLIRYAVWPDYPSLADGQAVTLPGLREAVQVTRKPDGLWKISAAGEHDALLAEGYLMARDRMGQLDLFRHLARGELAALLGKRSFGERTSLEVDRLNRFLGFRAAAEFLYAHTSREERQGLDAFVDGINLWIEAGQRSLEHRLLGVRTVRAWTAVDSLAIYVMLMHGLGGNADREIRRLVIACSAGIDAVERVWPTDSEFQDHALPADDLHAQSYLPQPAVVGELVRELPELCAQGAADSYEPMNAATNVGDRAAASARTSPLAFLGQSLTASNNWVVAGTHTDSGKPILSNDPHLPHMNPPMAWGVDIEHPGFRTAGFMIAGLHRVVFGHNGHVAWGATTNHVDRQDLVVHRGRSEIVEGTRVEGYEVEGRFIPFEYRTEMFDVKGAPSVRVTARFTKDGPLLNDLEPFLKGRIPLTALRVVPIGRGTDLDGARAINRARTAADFAAGVELFDLGCSSWVFADAEGNIGFRSPCLVPIRRGWRGTFPIPGWLRSYEWQGFYPKERLPVSTNPARGWLVTANSQIVPSSRFPTAYNNDASAPDRFRRIAERLRVARTSGGLAAATSAAIQLDTVYGSWPALRDELNSGFCQRSQGGDTRREDARRRLCNWGGDMDAASATPTLFVLWTHALLDRALADDLPGGPVGDVWHYTQSLLQFEANVHRLWLRPEADRVWDDLGTAALETKSEMLERALSDALAEGTTRYGARLEDWKWGRTRPFVLEHPFATGGSILGRFLNSEAMPIGGGTETVFKQQFPRSDRRRMHPAVGPIVRFTVDMASPWSATYTLAGGESGWPGSSFYGNLLEDWQVGRERPMTPAPSPEDVRVQFLPGPTDVVSRPGPEQAK